MKIEVMQMNKRIAFGRCVIVLYLCHTPPKKVYNQMYLVETTALLSICAHSFAAAVKKRKADSGQSTNNPTARSDFLQHFIRLN